MIDDMGTGAPWHFFGQERGVIRQRGDRGDESSHGVT